MSAAAPIRRFVLLTALTVAASLTACDDALEGASPGLEAAVKAAAERFPDHRRRKIVLLGFDSCDPDLVDDMIRKGELPNFARLRGEGVSGKLRSIPPYLSPVVWTTVSTGMTPDRHGILDFTTNRDGNSVPISSRERQADNVWELLSRCGEKVGVVGWLVTHPAEPIPQGFIVTERVGLLAFEYDRAESAATDKSLTHPTALARAITEDKVDVADIPLGRVRAFANVTETEYAQSFSRKFAGDNPLGNLRLTLATAESFRNIGLRLLEQERPRFFAGYFEAMDVLSHQFMRYAPPRAPGVDEATFRRYRDAIRANYQWHDRVLGEYMERCDADTTLLLVSDHGFKNGTYRLDDPSEFHAKTGAQWHRTYGSFFAWGNGVKHGARLDGASVYDIAPTVLAAMGYPVPKEMPGRVLTEVFDEGLEFETVDSYFGQERRRRVVEALGTSVAAGSEEAADRELMEKFAANGYIGADPGAGSSGQFNLGSVLMARGQLKAAREQFQGVLNGELELLSLRKGGPTPRTYFALAQVSQALEEYADAEKFLTAATDLVRRGAENLRAAIARGAAPSGVESPDDMLLSARVQELMLRVPMLEKRGDVDTSVLLARELVQLKPRVPQSHLQLANALAAQSRTQRGNQNFAGAVAAHREALERYARSLELEPNQYYTLKEIARQRLEGHVWTKADSLETYELLQQARKELEQALELFPRSNDALNNYTIALMRLGIWFGRQRRDEESQDCFAKARDVSERTVGLYPAYAKGWANRAYLFWQTGDLAGALEAARRAQQAQADYAFNADLLTAFEANGLSLPK
jgi:tetratricopeptide (TPR) repeat protein